MFKTASVLKLRFQTNRGLLSTEQLWDLSQNDLAEAIKSAKKTLVKNNDDELSFLDTSSEVNSVDQLKFDILKDVYITKKKEMEEAKNAVSIKLHNQKIDALIAEKQEGKLREMSIEDLEKLRK